MEEFLGDIILILDWVSETLFAETSVKNQGSHFSGKRLSTRLILE